MLPTISSAALDTWLSSAQTLEAAVQLFSSAALSSSASRPACRAVAFASSMCLTTASRSRIAVLTDSLLRSAASAASLSAALTLSTLLSALLVSSLETWGR